MVGADTSGRFFDMSACDTKAPGILSFAMTLGLELTWGWLADTIARNRADAAG